MNLHLTGRHMEITPALRQQTEKKLQTLKHLYDKIDRIDVTFSIEHLEQRVEAHVHVPHHSFHAKAQAFDMYEAIDLLTDKLFAQIAKYKEKITSHRE